MHPQRPLMTCTVPVGCRGVGPGRWLGGRGASVKLPA